jgi:hypothetical protein
MMFLSRVTRNVPRSTETITSVVFNMDCFGSALSGVLRPSLLETSRGSWPASVVVAMSCEAPVANIPLWAGVDRCEDAMMVEVNFNLKSIYLGKYATSDRSETDTVPMSIEFYNASVNNKMRTIPLFYMYTTIPTFIANKDSKSSRLSIKF